MSLSFILQTFANIFVMGVVFMEFETLKEVKGLFVWFGWLVFSSVLIHFLHKNRKQISVFLQYSVQHFLHNSHSIMFCQINSSCVVYDDSHS